MYLLYTLLTTFLVSLLGSLHCLAMCGGFAAFCSNTSTSPKQMTAAYHLGRGVAYVFLGALAGFFGREINKAGQGFGIEWLSGFVVGVVLIATTISALFPERGTSRIKKFFTALVPSLSTAHTQLVRIATRSPKGSGLALGISSGFLPCGWLYTFVIAAAGQGTALSGALIMSAFWVGTIPVLLFGGSCAAWLTVTLGPRARVFSIIAVLLVGCYSLFRHLSLPANVVAACH